MLNSFGAQENLEVLQLEHYRFRPWLCEIHVPEVRLVKSHFREAQGSRRKRVGREQLALEHCNGFRHFAISQTRQEAVN